MKAMMAAMSGAGKVQSFTKDQLETIAKAMALATEGEVKDLKRTVRAKAPRTRYAQDEGPRTPARATRKASSEAR